ncbi:MAG TPA: hypothetical protein VM427_05400 [Patescibacteria group bacterium]|nr:hypothetical protein [Patescibacteria group bacterium]
MRAYPRAFRVRYADEMVQLFGDLLRDERAARGVGGLALTWIRSLIDLASSSIGEHLAGDPAVGQSLPGFEPTRTMRWLGLFGLVGCVLLLLAFVTWVPFESLAVNTVRLLMFALAGAAIAIAFHGTQAGSSPRIATVATGAVVIAGIWHAVWNVLGLWVPSRFSGGFGSIGALASLALWLTPTLYGGAMLRIGVAWRGMSRWRAGATRIAAVVLLGSFLAAAGDDRWGLVRSEAYGPLWSTLALVGVLASGAGWAVLGAVLVFGGRRRVGPGA